MNNVISFCNRQIGNRINKEYDSVLSRLKCLRIDDVDLHSNIESDYEPPALACKFAETKGYEDVLALGSEGGCLVINNTSILSKSSSKTFKAHYNALFDLAWMPGDMKLVTASGDHTTRLWDVSNSGITQEHIFYGHGRSVKTVAFRKNDNSVFASGARDGAIFLWDTRAHIDQNSMRKPDGVIFNSHNVPLTPGSKHKKRISKYDTLSRASSVTGLVFQDDVTLLSCAAGDGLIKVWDLRKSYSNYKRDPWPKNTIPYCGTSTKNGYTDLLVDHGGIKLYASCLDNTIYCFNISTYSHEPVMQYIGHQMQNSFYVKSCLSPDGLYLLSGSSDEKAYIWNVKYETPLCCLDGHTSEVTCVAWCRASDLKIVTCSDDTTLKIWRIGNENTDKDEVCGKTEVLPKDMLRHKLDNTPRSCKRVNESTPDNNCGTKKARLTFEKRTCLTSGEIEEDFLCTLGKKRSCDLTCQQADSFKKARVLCEKCENSTPGKFNENVLCENCVNLKREHSPCDGNSSKKVKYDIQNNPRRLFDIKTHIENSGLSTIDENCSIDYDFSQPSTSAPMRTPTKRNRHSFSPTTNLPNFVVDGTAPHLKLISPRKRKEDKNWLSKLRRDKELTERMAREANPNSPNYLLESNFEEINSPSRKKITPKRKSNSDSKKRNKTPAAQSLLKFFKVSTNTSSRKLYETQTCTNPTSIQNIPDTN